jgi:hypothetical protein
MEILFVFLAKKNLEKNYQKIDWERKMLIGAKEVL